MENVEKHRILPRIAPNLLNRDFTATALNQKWVTDGNWLTEKLLPITLRHARSFHW